MLWRGKVAEDGKGTEWQPRRILEWQVWLIQAWSGMAGGVDNLRKLWQNGNTQ